MNRILYDHFWVFITGRNWYHLDVFAIGQNFDLLCAPHFSTSEWVLYLIFNLSQIQIVIPNWSLSFDCLKCPACFISQFTEYNIHFFLSCNHSWGKYDSGFLLCILMTFTWATWKPFTPLSASCNFKYTNLHTKSLKIKHMLTPYKNPHRG